MVGQDIMLAGHCRASSTMTGAILSGARVKLFSSSS